MKKGKRKFEYGLYHKITVMGTNCLIHKFLDWDGLKSLYQYDVAPNGIQIVCDIEKYYRIIEKSRYTPISIQMLSPDAPLTSSISLEMEL